MSVPWSRRTLVKAALAGGVGVAAGGARSTFGWPLGVQLWSVNAEMERDVTGTLARLGMLGYREVELAGLHGLTPAAFAAAAERAGVRPVGTHYGLGGPLADPARCIGETRDVGAHWLGIASPEPYRALATGVDWPVAIRDAMTAGAWRRNADSLNELAVKAQAAGLRLAYHNHPIEFARYGEQTGMDILLAHTDPALVKWELDVAWAVAGGIDPAALLRDHRGRIRLLHAKGLKAKPRPGGYNPDFATGVIGRGDVVDWRSVLAAARGSVEHVFVEQEPPHTTPIFTALAQCRDALAQM